MEKIAPLSDYEIKDIIGIGNFGEVKLGINKETKEKVAIKIIDKDKMIKCNNIERIKREFKIIKELDHLNIIKTYSIRDDPKKFYIIMEYCEKGELFKYIIKNKKLKENEAAFFFYQIINGIEYIHNKNIVHRDMKPENLLITENNIIKIIDFGLSNYFYNNNLLSTLCGSPSYSSPELLSGEKYEGFPVDIWSIGITLFAMIFGYLPFRDNNNKSLYKKIVECNIEYPDFSCVSLVAKDLLKKILIKDPKKRLNIQQIKQHPFYLKGRHIFKKTFPILYEQMENTFEKKNDNNNTINNDYEEKMIQNIVIKNKNKNNLRYLRNNSPYKLGKYLNMTKIKNYSKEKNSNDKMNDISSFIYIKKNDIKSEDIKIKSINKYKRNSYRNNIDFCLTTNVKNNINNKIENKNNFNITINKNRYNKTPNKQKLEKSLRNNGKTKINKTYRYKKKTTVSPNMIGNTKKTQKILGKNKVQNNLKNSIKNILKRNKEFIKRIENKKITIKNKKKTEKENYYSICHTLGTIEDKENSSNYLNKNVKKKINFNEEDSNINNITKNINNIKVCLNNNNQGKNYIINDITKFNNISKINVNPTNYLKNINNNDIDINFHYRNTLSFGPQKYPFRKKINDQNLKSKTHLSHLSFRNNNIYNYGFKTLLNSQSLNDKAQKYLFSENNINKSESKKDIFKFNIKTLQSIENKRTKKNFIINKALSNNQINKNKNLYNSANNSHFNSPIHNWKKKSEVLGNDYIFNSNTCINQRLKIKSIIINKKSFIKPSLNINDHSNINNSYHFNESNINEENRYTFSPNEYINTDINKTEIINNNEQSMTSHIINKNINRKKLLKSHLIINRTIENLNVSNICEKKYIFGDNNEKHYKNYNIKTSINHQNNINPEDISFNKNKKSGILKNYKKYIKINSNDNLNYISIISSEDLSRQKPNNNLINNINSSIISEIKAKRDNNENDSLYYNNYSNYLYTSNN